MEAVFLFAGQINATGRILYWKSESNMTIGDFAIVENMNGYDLIKVIGKILTTKESAKNFSNTEYEKMKKVVQKIELKI